MKPVNILSYKYNPKAKYGCFIQLVIDDIPLIDLLESAIPEEAEYRNWHEKREALLVKENLFATIDESGNKDILTCAGCRRPDDIYLDGCVIEHDGDFITWEMHPPGYEIFFDKAETIKLKFHKPQYEKVVKEIMEIKQ
ncbi:MAG: hypothetical protein KME63_09425 [Candidatus Thiodiazotropha sp. (ex Clathrolucina costata)]|nr:hypothetical protein [Candidatus Thiodiazotropha taylori]MCG7864301.1 hypothetical protein [Candidatus Thiodiazotropha endolucinida]